MPVQEEVRLTDRDTQTLRLMLMMYRQGWLDASESLSKQSARIGHTIHRQYKGLV